MLRRTAHADQAVRFARGLFPIIGITLVCSLFIPNVREDAVFMLMPSASLAYSDGTKHFDARDPKTYDIKRARYFFTKAIVLDPNVPLAHHQLSRIEFLRGDFSFALTLINQEFAVNPHPSASSYYMRGLIKGFMGDYAGAAEDYQTYLHTDPTNWAAINDYAWVLLKAGRAKEALAATLKGLQYFPENPWLLNSNAIALYETGNIKKARERAKAALAATEKITTEQWLKAYPGNDPLIAEAGVAAFKDAAIHNMHMLMLATSSHAVQLDLTHE